MCVLISDQSLVPIDPCFFVHLDRKKPPIPMLLVLLSISLYFPWVLSCVALSLWLVSRCVRSIPDPKVLLYWSGSLDTYQDPDPTRLPSIIKKEKKFKHHITALKFS